MAAGLASWLELEAPMKVFRPQDWASLRAGRFPLSRLGRLVSLTVSASEVDETDGASREKTLPVEVRLEINRKQ